MPLYHIWFPDKEHGSLSKAKYMTETDAPTPIKALSNLISNILEKGHIMYEGEIYNKFKKGLLINKLKENDDWNYGVENPIASLTFINGPKSPYQHSTTPQHTSPSHLPKIKKEDPEVKKLIKQKTDIEKKLKKLTLANVIYKIAWETKIAALKRISFKELPQNFRDILATVPLTEPDTYQISVDTTAGDYILILKRNKVLTEDQELRLSKIPSYEGMEPYRGMLSLIFSGILEESEEINSYEDLPQVIQDTLDTAKLTHNIQTVKLSPKKEFLIYLKPNIRLNKISTWALQKNRYYNRKPKVDNNKLILTFSSIPIRRS
jgi:hypothetical protein